MLRYDIFMAERFECSRPYGANIVSPNIVALHEGQIYSVQEPSMKRTLVFITLLVVLASSCVIAVTPGNYVGNGKVITTSLPVSGYTAVKNMSSAHIRLHQDLTRSVKVTIDENLLEFLDIHVENGTLVVALLPGKSLYRYTKFTVDVSMPSLTGLGIYGSGEIALVNDFSGRSIALTIAGSGDIEGELEYDEVKASIMGSGSIRINGSAESFEGSIGGSGSIQARSFSAEDAELSIRGSGSMTLKVESSLDARIFGSGSIYYYGNPRVSIVDAGSGRLVQLGR